MISKANAFNFQTSLLSVLISELLSKLQRRFICKYYHERPRHLKLCPAGIAEIFSSVQKVILHGDRVSVIKVSVVLTLMLRQDLVFVGKLTYAEGNVELSECISTGF